MSKRATEIAIWQSLLGLAEAGGIAQLVCQAAEIAGRLSQGDMSTNIEIISKDETGQLMATMQGMTNAK